MFIVVVKGDQIWPNIAMLAAKAMSLFPKVLKTIKLNRFASR
jgi:hypothetical protein